MNKREFLKAGGGGLVAAALARPAFAVPGRRIAVVQPDLPGAAAFAEAERAAGAEILVPKGDAVRWFRATLRPALGRGPVSAFTDATHTLILEGSLREAGYVRAGQALRQGRATSWRAVPRS